MSPTFISIVTLAGLIVVAGMCRRIYMKATATPRTGENAWPPSYNVELDSSEQNSYCVKVTIPNCYTRYDYPYTASQVEVANEIVSDSSFELLRKDDIGNGLDAGDTGFVYRIMNSPANVLALLACDLTWSEQAKILALMHAIPEETVITAREQIRHRISTRYLPRILDDCTE